MDYGESNNLIKKLLQKNFTKEARLKMLREIDEKHSSVNPSRIELDDDYYLALWAEVNCCLYPTGWYPKDEKNKSSHTHELGEFLFDDDE